MQTKHSSERGQVLVIVVVAMFGLIGLTGLAIDGSRAYSDRRQAQNAADTAVLAAALAHVRTPDDDWTAVAFTRATSNGYDDNETTNFVDVYYPPASGPYAGNTEYVQVVIKSIIDTMFGRVVGIETLTNEVEAVARITPSVPTSLYDGNAVVGLAPAECQAVKWQGNANSTVSGGGIFVNSNCDNGAFFNQSGSATLHAPSITAVGDVRDNGGLDVSSITENSQYQAMAYPPNEYILPNPDCDVDTVQTGETLSPGNFNGAKFPPNGVKFLESGVYCVNNGDFTLTNAHDTIEGHGVFIWVDKGEVRLNGGTVILDPPTTGPYHGFTIYLPITNSNKVVINGNTDDIFEGTILAPASDILINGTGDAGIVGQIIGYTVTLTGTSGVTIQYDDEKVWHTLTSPSIELMQ